MADVNEVKEEIADVSFLYLLLVVYFRSVEFD